jgi:hypothetical protein
MAALAAGVVPEVGCVVAEVAGVRELLLEVGDCVCELSRPDELLQRVSDADGVADRNEEEVDFVLDPCKRLRPTLAWAKPVGLEVGVDVLTRGVDARELRTDSRLPDMRRTPRACEVEELA